MSQENVETYRRYVDRLNDTGEPATDLCQPDIEIHMFKGSPIPGPYKGHDGVRQWRQDTFDVIEDWRLEIREVVATDDRDVLVVAHRFAGQTRHTDLSVAFPLFVVVKFRDGLLNRIVGYRQRREALEAAGLSE